MTPSDLIDDLKSRINPAYAHTIGTESYERRLCVEALEDLMAELREQKKLFEDYRQFMAGAAIDAERYRFIRDGFSDIFCIEDMRTPELESRSLWEEELDAAVDAAMKQ